MRSVVSSSIRNFVTQSRVPSCLSSSSNVAAAVTTTVASNSRNITTAMCLPTTFNCASSMILNQSSSSALNVSFKASECRTLSRSFSTNKLVTIPVPSMGDSITEGTLVRWLKSVGDAVAVDEVIAVIETDKVSVDIRSPFAGALRQTSATEGTTVKVGADLAQLEIGAVGATAAAAPAKTEAPKAEAPKAEAPKTEAPKAEAPKATPAPAAAATKDKDSGKKMATPPPPAPAFVPTPGSRTEKRVPMSRMRLRIAERLKEAQNTAASLTTFNEIDMSAIMSLRAKYKDEFAEKHKTKLGFMSCFVKAAANALVAQPDVNAFIDGKDVVYRDYVDISVAVATPTGLVVPVLRNCETMNFAQVEAAIAALGDKARKGQIAIEDMVGGTFTISNGGVYGSLMGTPILNPPQSAILGMHGIFQRPVVVDGQIVIRPMMYVALTYDHRIIDGAGAVTFLKRVKNAVEDPSRMLLDL